MLTKGEVMKKLGMTSGVDSALPHDIVCVIHEKSGLDYEAIADNFVMDYRDASVFGQLTPITTMGLDILADINNKMGWDIPSPKKVVDLRTGIIWEGCDGV